MSNKETEQNTDNQTTESTEQKYEFQSEVKQLLNILVYSLYKHKEIFLREMISNAVDALNKVQFESLSNSDIEDKDLELKIDIKMDAEKNILIIEDTGIGMTRRELIDNIGTIAHSGTLDFVKKITEAETKDKMDLIGQFGVGFYSSFMVAEEIHVHTKSFQKGSKGLLWKSKGDTSYTIEEKGKQHRGTRIELHLKEDEKQFTGKSRLQNIIKQHSKFVPFPIFIDGEEVESVEAIWTQPKNSLSENDYNEFYRFFQNGNEDPETHLHLSSDAPVPFNAVFYVPKFNSETYGWIKIDPGVDLYSKKVLIQKACPEILPPYFRFIKGVVDSEDIPLNISRESIQGDAKIGKIRKYCMKKILEHFTKLKNEEDNDTWLRIWKNFNKNFKEGVPNEYEYREQLAMLLMFQSSKTPKEEFTDIEAYYQRMNEEQIEIYYATGENYEIIHNNPALEAFRKKDLEVLYADPMDAWAIGHMQQYKGKIFRPVEAANIKLDEEDEKDAEARKEAENLATYLKTVYGDKINEVKLSQRLVDSPCILVDSKVSPSLPLDQKMRKDRKRADFSKKDMEFNPKNKLILEMVRIHKDAPDSPTLKLLALQLLDNLILREGITEDIENIVPRMHDIMLEAARKE